MIPLTDVHIRTLRLKLIPLSYAQLVKYTYLDYTLESELGLVIRDREITTEFKFTLENYLLPYLTANPEQLLFATIWLIILKNERYIVGDIGFNAGPTEKGVIEVGYSTYPEHMNKGYMTEALAALANWAFTQQYVNIIVAQTDKSNTASQAVLKKNGFITFVEVENSYWWRLDKDTSDLKLKNNEKIPNNLR